MISAARIQCSILGCRAGCCLRALRRRRSCGCGAQAPCWGGRVSAYTGLPTLLGWPWHEYQQRSIALASRVIDSRERLIKRLYTVASPGEILHNLQLYGVEYVYVGQLERALYLPAGLARF